MNTRKIAVEYRMSHWAGIMQQRAESGLSVKAFCEREGFHENIYYYWQRKLRDAASEQLAEIESDKMRTGLVPTGFTEVRLQEATVNTTQSRYTEQGALHFDIAGIGFTASSNYPPEHIAALLRRMTSQ